MATKYKCIHCVNLVDLMYTIPCYKCKIYYGSMYKKNEAILPLIKECRHCGTEFKPKRIDQVFCVVRCNRLHQIKKQYAVHMTDIKKERLAYYKRNKQALKEKAVLRSIRADHQPATG